MLPKIASKFLTRRLLLLFGILFVSLGFGSLGGVGASPATRDATPVEPGAGTWTTWVLDSASQFRLSAPSPEIAQLTHYQHACESSDRCGYSVTVTEELAQLKAMVAERDAVALQQIAYWNSGSPSYRWNQIALDAMNARAMPANMAFRDLALVHVAIYDATLAAWDSKYTYNRQRPSEVDPSLTTVIPNPSNPSYPSEYAVTAGAASTVLAWLFPEDAQFFLDKAQESVRSRLLAGVEYPSDVEAGLKLGQQVADLVIARGKADGSDAKWTGSIPTEAGHWTGENPAFPTAGSWKTWVLTSGDEFRSPPPPAYDSAQEATDMAELKSFERTPVTNALAMFWEFGAGGRRIHWFWNDVASRLIMEARWDDNAPRAARAYALANIAGLDGMIACFDAKYTYWSMRPFQVDSEFKPLFTTPNHPSYPSAHGCISSAVAGVLADLFPVNAEEVLGLAQQASESRIWGGIHFRTDVVVGVQLGQDVAEAVMARALNDGS
jgi:membrane-associated phospholipid phosphatase